MGQTRVQVLALMAAAAALPFAFYVRGEYAIVLTVLVQELLYQVLYLVPCFLVGRVIVRATVRDEVNSAVGVASSVAAGLGLVGMVVLGLGLMGVLSSGIAWTLLIGCAVIGLLDARSLSANLADTQKRLADWFRAPSEGGWIWMVAAMLFMIPVVGATLIPGMLWRPDDPHPYDSLIYHLQLPREWYELGRIVPLAHNVYSFFPLNIEMHYLVSDYLRGSPWLAMQMNQCLSISFTLLMAMAMRGWIRARWGGRAAAVGCAAVLTTPWILMLACVTYVEAGMLLWCLLAMVWFIDAIEKRSMARFALAGVMCGLACGAKFTGVPMLMIGMPAAALVGLALSRFAVCPARKWLMGSIVYGAIGMTVLSPWLIRNAAWAGNPVFPNAMRVLGKGHFSDTQVERWERAHRPAAEHALWVVRGQRLIEQVLLNWRYDYILWPLAMLSLIVNRRRMEAVTLAALIVLTMIFWLTVTHLMGRFFVMAILPAGLLVAMLPARWLVATAALLLLAGVNSWIGPTLSIGQVNQGTDNLHTLFEYHTEKGRQGLYGLQSYGMIDPEDLARRVQDAREVVLVGNTQVFYRQTPMVKLRYCTVFDLNTDGREIIDAYYGPPPAKCPSDALLLIDIHEAQRLSKTYWNVPPVPLPPPERFRNYGVIR